MDGLPNGRWRRMFLWFIVSVVVGLLSVLSPVAILWTHGHSLDIPLFYSVTRDGSPLVFSIVLLLTTYMEHQDASPTSQPGLGFGLALLVFLLALVVYVSNATELLAHRDEPNWLPHVNFFRVQPLVALTAVVLASGLKLGAMSARISRREN